MDIVVYIPHHLYPFYSAIKINEKKMPLIATWMDLETVKLNEVSHTEKSKHDVMSLTCGIYTMAQMQYSIKQKQTQPQRADMWFPRRVGVREGGMLPKVWLPVHRRGQRETWRQSLEEIEKNSFIIFARQKGYTAG